MIYNSDFRCKSSEGYLGLAGARYFNGEICTCVIIAQQTTAKDSEHQAPHLYVSNCAPCICSNLSIPLSVLQMGHMHV